MRPRLDRDVPRLEALHSHTDKAAPAMTSPDLNALPLHELYEFTNTTLSMADFAAAVDERLHDGRADEVRTFFRDCEERCINRLSHLNRDEAPWMKDAERWLAFVRLTLPRGQVFSAARDMPRSAELSGIVRTLAEQRLAEARAAHLPPNMGIGPVILRLLPWLAYPGMPYKESIAALDWILALRTEAGVGRDNDYWTNWQPYIAVLNDDDLLRYAAVGGALFKDIIKHYQRERVTRNSRGESWRLWKAFFASHPRLYDEVYIEDVDLLDQRWDSANAQLRVDLGCKLMSWLGYDDQFDSDHLKAVFDRRLRESPDAFVPYMKESGRYQVSPGLARHVIAAGHKSLLPLLLPAIAQRCEYSEELKEYAELIRELAASRPNDLNGIGAKDLVNILPAFDRDTLRATLPTLTPIISGSSSKALRAALADIAGQFEPAWLIEAGWLKKPPKNLLLVCRDVLLAHPDPSAGPLLAELLASGKLDVASASTVAQRLQALGLAGQNTGVTTTDLAPGATSPSAPNAPSAAGNPASLPNLDALEAEAAKVKRLAAAIKPFDTPGMLERCAPLSEHAARVLLHLAATAEGALPPLAAQLLAHMTPENRARLALALVEHWIAADGDPKRRWALKLVPGNADDRVVDLFMKAINDWNRPRLQRAAAATEQLGEVDTLYALLRVQEISESRKLKDLVVRAARAALRAAAARRKMSVAELFDEVTPDFGLGAGLNLSVGPQTYRIELQGDLSLRVIDDKGKARKSIPAVKDESLKSEWEAAGEQLKTLTASLKTVIKQQGPRMQAALVTGKRWPRARWQRLFVEHPLLRIVGRSLIWRIEDAPQLAHTSFRLAEDFSLVDVEDDPVSLPDDCSISLWHPATAADGEREAWQANLADYELDALVDQLGACAELPGEAQFKNGMLLPPAPITVAQEQLSSLFKKHGYRPGPVGDGPSINEHIWRLPALEMCIEVAHDYYPPYMELGLPVSVEHIRVIDLSDDDWREVDVAGLPTPLLATLQGQFLAMAAKALPAE